MSEKQTHNPEANTQTVIELYQQAAKYLETAIHLGTAKKDPALYAHVAMLKISADVPDLNKKRMVLEYDRPATDNDPTQADSDIPLAWNDETGLNHWQTPIRVAVYGSDDKLLHDYIIEYTGVEDWARVIDDKLQPGQNFDDYGGITQLDASEAIGQLEWGLENLHFQD